MQLPLLQNSKLLASQYVVVAYDRNHYFGFGLIPKLKPKLVDTFGRYRKRYRNHSIANSSLSPTSMYLHSNSTQILALKKKMVFLQKKNLSKKNIFFYIFP